MSTTATELTFQPKVDHGKHGRYFEPVQEANLIKRIVGENCSIAGGAAAVLLQIASKGVGRGVAAHSSFTSKPVQRARRSLFYIYVMAFGNLKERRIVTDATHQAHARVKGQGYDANDVELQLWVAATTYWSLLVSYEEVWGKLDDEDADEVYKEFSVMATGLRVPPERWPKDRKAFQEYWDKMIDSLEVTDEVREVAQDVLYPGKNMPWGYWLYAKLIGPSTRITTIEMLPEKVRNEFGIPSTAYTRGAYWLMTQYSRIMYPLLPEAFRHWVKDYHMQDFRDRVARGDRL